MHGPQKIPNAGCVINNQRLYQWLISQEGEGEGSDLINLEIDFGWCLKF